MSAGIDDDLALFESRSSGVPVTRHQLLACARDLIEITTAQGLTLRALARIAGVSEAEPFREFENKTQLLAALARHGVEELNERLRSAADHAISPQGRLYAAGAAYVTFAAQNRELFLLSQGAAFPDDRAPDDLRVARQETLRILSRAVDDCLAGSTEDERRDVLAAGWALMHGIACLSNDGRFGELIPHDDLKALSQRLMSFIALPKEGHFRT